MLTAVVLIHVEPDKIPEVAKAIANLEGISEVFSVTGDVDLIAIAKVREHEDLAEVIPGGVGKVEGVLDTQTFIAFKTYSHEALASAYSLGLDD